MESNLYEIIAKFQQKKALYKIQNNKSLNMLSELNFPLTINKGIIKINPVSLIERMVIF